MQTNLVEFFSTTATVESFTHFQLVEISSMPFNTLATFIRQTRALKSHQNDF